MLSLKKNNELVNYKHNCKYIGFYPKCASILGVDHYEVCDNAKQHVLALEKSQLNDEDLRFILKLFFQIND